MLKATLAVMTAAALGVAVLLDDGTAGSIDLADIQHIDTTVSQRTLTLADTL